MTSPLTQRKTATLSDRLVEICDAVPVIPVLSMNDAEHAQGIADCFVAAGLPVIEVTLRTPNAIEIIQLMSSVPGAIVGAGTVLTESQLRSAKGAGATFAVSPGCTELLLTAAVHSSIPFLPGAATASEAMWALEHGVHFQKLFPAESVGGTGLLNSLAAPLPQVTFCPTGGIRIDSASNYLSLPSVRCVGGSWLYVEENGSEPNWKVLESSAYEAASLNSSETT